MNQNYQLLAFTVYTILYEMIIWGVFGYAVFIAGHSGWWMVLAVFMSSQQLKFKSFAATKEEEKQ